MELLVLLLMCEQLLDREESLVGEWQVENVGMDIAHAHAQLQLMYYHSLLILLLLLLRRARTA